MVSIMKPAVITFIICLLALHVEGKRPGTKPSPPPRPPAKTSKRPTGGGPGIKIPPGGGSYGSGTPICKCSGQGINSMHPRLFKNEQIYEASRFCPRREITVETANRVKQCVDPESNLGKFIIRKRSGYYGNCTCSDQVIKSMHPSLIRNHAIYEVTQFCPGREIVVTTTDGKKPCVNPESNLGNFIYDFRRTGQSDRCKCPDQGINHMNSSLIKDYQIHEASRFCPSTEIIVTTTNGTKACVNPESHFGKNIYTLKTGHGVGVGVGVGVSVFVLILILIGVCCWKKKELSPTSE